MVIHTRSGSSDLCGGGGDRAVESGRRVSALSHSVARAFVPRVIGVQLSRVLGDGVLRLAAIRPCGEGTERALAVFRQWMPIRSSSPGDVGG
jgi:hypothetical protein